MIQKRLAVISFLLFAGCASGENSEPANAMEYGCDDLVVVGRVKTLASELIDDPASLLGISTYRTEIAISRVIRGVERKTVVRAIGASHAQIRDDIDMLIVLSKSEGGHGYRIRTLNVVGLSRLAERCTD